MKNVLTIATAILLSTAVHAEDQIVAPEVVDAAQGAISNPVEAGAVSEITQLNDPISQADLWKSLDSNEDGSISKEEAADSKEIAENWESLDANKDEKLDSEEFAQLFPAEK
jgi:hypothetical protein